MLILGSISIIIAIIKLSKIIKLDKVKLNRKTHVIKGKEGFFKFQGSLYCIFGIIGISISIFALSKKLLIV